MWRAATSRRALPRGPGLALALLLAAQILWRAQHAPAPPAPADLPPPAPPSLLWAAALGEPIPLAGVLGLWVLSMGDGPGSRPFARLDYARLEGWLETLLVLDPRGQTPLLAASHVFSQVPDPERQRHMLEFVHRAASADPERRWRWLAHAALVAKHRLRDLPLALRYARTVARTPPGPAVPAWVRELPVFILEEMGEVEAARVELGALLASGSIADPAERRFLTERLLALEEQGHAEKSASPSEIRQPAP